MERKKLSAEEVGAKLGGLNGWKFDDDRLSKKYGFTNFAESLAFINRVGEIAEAADHHPDIKLGWGYAEVETTTHDRGGVTDVDIAFAEKIDLLK